jgi:transketolase
MQQAKLKHLTSEELDQLAINTIRTLSIDAVQQAKSGHPGTPMALAPMVYTIWNRVLRFDPQDPIWPNRDRFKPGSGGAWTAAFVGGVLQVLRRRAQCRNVVAVGRRRRRR